MILLKWAITFYIAYFLYKRFFAPALPPKRERDHFSHDNRSNRTKKSDLENDKSDGDYIDYEELD